MQQTLVQKILGRKSGRIEVKPGEMVTVPIDKVMIHDLFIRPTWESFQEMGFAKIWDPDKVVLVWDHLVPTTRIEDPGQHQIGEAFAKQYGIKKVHRQDGICHQLMVEKHYARPGEIILGTDSHTTTYGAISAFSTGIGYSEMAAVLGTGSLWLKVPETIRIDIEGKLNPNVRAKDMILRIIGDLGCDGATYRTLEFGGSLVQHLSVSERMTMANMAVECGAKVGIFEADEVTAQEYSLSMEEQEGLKADEDAKYIKHLVYKGEEFEVVAACPSAVDQIRPVTQLEGQRVDEVFIGSCTNGRYEDLLEAAEILRGQKIASCVRCIITPASRAVYEKAVKSGIMKDLIEAGAMVTTPGCGLCCGRAGGIVCEEQVVLATNNRNFLGRMGSASAKIYLVSPRTAALSALKGWITNKE